MTPEGIRRANAGKGVNILILNRGWEKSENTEEQTQIVQKLIESFVAFHRGYRVKELENLTFGPRKLTQ